MARGKRPKEPKHVQRPLNPGVEPDINMPSRHHLSGTELRAVMERQWATGRVNNGTKKAKWKT